MCDDLISAINADMIIDRRFLFFFPSFFVSHLKGSNTLFYVLNQNRSTRFFLPRFILLCENKNCNEKAVFYGHNEDQLNIWWFFNSLGNIGNGNCALSVWMNLLDYLFTQIQGKIIDLKVTLNPNLSWMPFMLKVSALNLKLFKNFKNSVKTPR